MPRWTLLQSQSVLDTPWMSVKKKTYRLDEQTTHHDYFVVERSPFVVVVALNEQAIVLVRHYRQGTDQTYLELPAGYREGNESPETAACRELLEETGLKASRADLIGELHPLPGYVRSSASVVVCSGLTRSGSEIDHHEIDQVEMIAFDEAVSMIVRGEIREMQAVSAILLARACGLAP